MDQKKTGYFLKQLRNEKKLTQEQLAEKFQITSRTVSRWETGSNMPDISMLLELADFYERITSLSSDVRPFPVSEENGRVI